MGLSFNVIEGKIIQNFGNKVVQLIQLKCFGVPQGYVLALNLYYLPTSTEFHFLNFLKLNSNKNQNVPCNGLATCTVCTPAFHPR